MKQTSTEPLSILVSSCDKYEDAWLPFFKLLDANWKDCKYPIYLNTESKEYQEEVCGQKIRHLHTPGGKSVPWSKALKGALKRIPTEFVFFLLEDFFLMSPVNSAEVEKGLARMQKDPGIANICFYPMESSNTTEAPEYPGFLKRNKSDPYLIHCQASIWRKEFLIKLLRSYEDAWCFESDGSFRARKLPGEYYCALENSPARFPYMLSPWHGYGLWRGRWLWNDKPLFEKFGIEADFSRRPTIASPEEMQSAFAVQLGTNSSTNAEEELKKQVLAEEEAYQNSFRYKVKSHLPEFFVEWILNLKKKK